MYCTSTQKRYWTFANEETLKEIRQETNKRFVQRFGEGMNVSMVDENVNYCWSNHLHNDTEFVLLQQDQKKREYFLTPDEERIILSYFEGTLKDFCYKFQPPMPKNVVGTAFHYFKRFYLYRSVMDYHPKEIL